MLQLLNNKLLSRINFYCKISKEYLLKDIYAFHVGCQFHTAVAMNSAIFRALNPCNSVIALRVRWTIHLRL
jgi:hypothetical protein